MIKSYKILSLLLSYPDAELQKFLPEAVSGLMNEVLVPPAVTEEIARFVDHFGRMDLTCWQSEYLQLFDFSRSTSLHLFEHIKGDSKDRGQAMVDLLEFYHDNGWQFSANELPDYLPAFLEFLSLRKIPEAAEWIAEPVDIINRIYLALKEKDNPYQYILTAVISLSANQPDGKDTASVNQNEKPSFPDNKKEVQPREFCRNNSGMTCNFF